MSVDSRERKSDCKIVEKGRSTVKERMSEIKVDRRRDSRKDHWK